jgi:hypothetical protein
MYIYKGDAQFETAKDKKYRTITINVLRSDVLTI